ncbi:MAG: Lrp/AsnC family transcriptional regulator [Bacillota bacterium]
MDKLDQLDQQILNEIQQGFPVVSRPYQVIGKKLGLSENEVFKRVSSLRRDGFIRRLGGVFDSKKLGYVSTLCAVSVPEEMIGRAAELINQYQGVTHHYLRDHHYNLWFTLIMESRNSLKETLSDLEKKLSEIISDCSLISLPARKTFKIKVQFKL